MDVFTQSQESSLFAKAQRFGKSFMLPIAVLPAAGILLGIGGALSNPNSVKAYPFLDIGWLQNVFTIMAAAGNVVFANLAILFAIGIAVGLARSVCTTSSIFLSGLRLWVARRSFRGSSWKVHSAFSLPSLVIRIPRSIILVFPASCPDASSP